MPLSDDELKDAICKKAATSPKPQLYIKDFYKCDPDSKPRKIKNVANELVREGRLMFWSSGSTPCMQTLLVFRTRRSKTANLAGLLILC